MEAVESVEAVEGSWISRLVAAVDVSKLVMDQSDAARNVAAALFGRWIPPFNSRRLFSEVTDNSSTGKSCRLVDPMDEIIWRLSLFLYYLLRQKVRIYL